MQKQPLLAYILLCLSTLPMVLSGCIPLPIPYRDELIKNEKVYDENNETTRPLITATAHNDEAGTTVLLKAEKEYAGPEQERSAWQRKRDYLWAPILIPVGVVALPFVGIYCIVDTCNSDDFKRLGRLLLGIGKPEFPVMASDPWVTEKTSVVSLRKPYPNAEVVARCGKEDPVETLLRADAEGMARFDPQSVPGHPALGVESMPCLFSIELFGRTASTEMEMAPSDSIHE